MTKETGKPRVGFTDLASGTAEDFRLIRELEGPHVALTPDRLLRELRSQEHDALEGFQVTRLEHAVQSATRALRDGADDDWIVAALLHDIGDGLAPMNHDRFAAEILRPYLREECVWTVEHHGLFQTYYFGHHYGWDRNARDKYRTHIYYRSCVDFCARWDQNSFDPAYPSQPLETFEPILRRVFDRKPYDPEVMQPGVVKGLPPPEES